MASASFTQSSGSLQIPPMSANPGSSRNYTQASPSSQSAASSSRPISVAAHVATSQNPPPASSSRRQRASHSVVSPSSNSQQQANSNSHHDDTTSPYADVYAHPAAVAYAAAHPRRTIPKFGPYLLLQTLGEGEFGKVKLGLHTQWGEEVAVKLIRRGNVDTTVRMSKVEREIEVLKTLKHPSIVRLYDVIETDKYIGIILEYASGGELFDHILAHRYLREKDAAKLFSQLISGVWYIHQKKIVHRDLKLENLLLDRHRNVIITDFGFANRFEHRQDDLMQTSCGSPCYAAPELVISDGLYVGSAVDIWSCGVILYAMLAGYLPFDDDPANPDGDNINLLYKYIVNTPLSFPEYISMEARDLLSMMLVPDPARRTTLNGVMRHPWLSVYHQTRTDGVPNAFGKTVEDLEMQALDQHQQRRLAYQRQMRANAIANGAATSPSRTQSHRPDHGTAPPPANRSRSTQPEYLYDSSVDQPMVVPESAAQTTPIQNGSARKNYNSPAALGLSEDDPFAGPGGVSAPNTAGPAIGSSSSSKPSTSDDPSRGASSTLSPNVTSPKGHKTNNSGGSSGFRHTIQVEYDDPSKNPRRSEDKRRERAGSQSQSQQQHPPVPTHQVQQHNGVVPTVPNTPTPVKERRPSQSSAKPLPPSPPSATTNHVSNTFSTHRTPPTSKSATTPSFNNSTPPKGSHPTEPNDTKQPTSEGLVVNVSSPPRTTSVAPSERQEKDKDGGSQNSSSSHKHNHKKGKSSLDRIGLGKIFGSGFGGGNNANLLPSPTPSTGDANSQGAQDGSATPVPLDGRSGSATSVLLSPVANEKESSGRKSRRNTLTVMVEPFRSVRGKKGKTASTPDGASTAGSKHPKPALTESPQAKSTLLPPTLTTAPVVDPSFSPAQDFGSGVDANGMQASTSKSRKVMQWFRTKSKGRDSIGFGAEEDSETPSSSKEKMGTFSQSKFRRGFSASSSTVNQTTTTSFGLNESGMAPVKVVVTTPNSAAPASSRASGHPHRSASSATEASSSFVSRFRNSVTVGGGSSQHRREADKSHPYGQLRIHHGAVDQMMISTRPPPEVMAHVKKVLKGMGIETQLESEYKLRCIRAKKKKGAMGHSAGSNATNGSAATGNGLAAVTMVGSAASNGVDKRGLPLPSPSAFSGTSGMLRGLLMRRQSSQVSTHGPVSSQPSLAFDDETSVVVSEPLLMEEAAYGDPNQDAGDEVRFSAELTRLDRLNDTYILDIRRLKGNLRSYKFLYDTLRDRADLSASQA